MRKPKKIKYPVKITLVNNEIIDGKVNETLAKNLVNVLRNSYPFLCLERDEEFIAINKAEIRKIVVTKPENLPYLAIDYPDAYYDEKLKESVNT